MPGTYIASSEMNDDESPPTEATETPPPSSPPPRECAMSPIPNGRAALESPKTPEDAPRIPRDDSFKTCKPTVPTPFSKRDGLRKTPARMSILSGGKPFKEAASSGRKKFNSRRRNNISLNPAANEAANDTANSNETFIRCEQELLFDRDSLEGPGAVSISRAKPLVQQQLHEQPESRRQSTPKKMLPDIKASSPKPPKTESAIERSITKTLQSAQPQQVQKQNQQQPQQTKAKETRQMLPPPSKTRPAQKRQLLTKHNYHNHQVQRNEARREPEAIRNNQFLTPKLPSFRKPPASLMGTTSRYMTSFNTSRITRSTSFKSTAELERDYFNSLRSF